MLHEIADLQWRKRVLIVLDADDAAQDLKALTKAKAPIDDRDITWFVIDGEAIATNYHGALKANFVRYLQATYDSSDSRVVFIGKDGGIKLRADQLNLKDIFSLTDSMPMRRREMLEAH